MTIEADRAEDACDYGVLTDEQLVDAIRQGNAYATDALILRYRSTVRAKARAYYLVGADREDIVQEGMIGLFKAIRDFRMDKLVTFRGFAELCITRQMITAIKSATRQKHIPLNGYVSLDKPIYEDESERTLMDLVCYTSDTDPEKLMIHREDFVRLAGQMDEMLSTLERNVLQLYLDGRSYQEIAQDLTRHVKSIDNALQRIKRKIERLLTMRNEASGHS
jgi:RNA polymerase sporulation-specific sigma factor